jgi:ribosomal protein S21
MIKVIVKNPEDIAEFDKAVKHFKKLVNNSKILEEVYDRKYYMKPSEKKRAKLRKEK